MESVLLALLGGAAGVLLSAWAGKVAWVSLTSFVAGFRDLRLELDVSPDRHVLLYGLVLSVITGMLFGLAPALRFTRPDLYTAIQAEGSLFGAGSGRSRLRGVLLAAQVAVSVLLLMVSGGLLGGVASSFVRAADLGFEPRDTYRVHVPAKGAFDPAGKFLRLRDRLETLPELTRVAIGGAPLQESLPVDVVAGARKVQASASFASDGYFETLGIRLLRGRGFTRGETAPGSPVAVISESAARTLWPGEDPLGKRFSVPAEDFGAALKFREYEVAGVVKDVRFANITRVDPAHVYVPAGAAARLMGGLLVRVGANREKALAAVESAVESVDPALLPSLDMMSLEDGPVAAWRGFYRALGAFAGVLTLVSLTLAGVGIYGVMAFLVSQRTREIGIRIAMGATSRAVVRSVVRQGLWPVLAGMLTGLGAAMWAVASIRASGAALAFNLFSGGFKTPGLYAGLGLMAVIAAVASIIPARRAARMDPMVALRRE
jgi:predicted permease